MTQKPRSQKNPASSPGLRPGQDIFNAKNSKASFPTVGMSLPTYPVKGASSRGRSRSTSAAAGTVVGGKILGEKKPRSIKKIIKRILLALVILLVLMGAWVGGKFLYNAYKLSNGNIFSVLQNVKLKGEENGRVTILLAGNSADDVGHDGAELTDSIMLLSIDTKNNQAYMLSIPRDLYVNIDGDYGKINSAYVAGKANDFTANGLPKGGMGQLEQIVEDNFGVDINYYALVNYNAFKEAVDAVGGITITVASDDPRGLYDPNIDYTNNKPLVKLSNGRHTLNGQAALDLARARGDAYNSYGFAQSDFDRASNQRQMLLALKTKAVSANVLANPAKLSSLADAIGGNVSTDMNLGEVRRLYDLTKSLGAEKIASISLNNVLGVNLLANYRAPNGSSALIPAAGVDDYSDIQTALKRATSSDPVVREQATVVVLNGTDTMGIASQLRTTLTGKNINVTAIGDALAPQAKTTIIDVSKGKKNGTKALLTKLYGNNVTTINPYSDAYDADFIIIAGSDQIKKSTNP
jgi:LCP family protein required for cell wall assembly